jgi:ActR/RegA family two-component response regulator
VLAQNDGNRSATARQLGVSRKTLERRLGPSGERVEDD